MFHIVWLPHGIIMCYLRCSQNLFKKCSVKRLAIAFEGAARGLMLNVLVPVPDPIWTVEAKYIKVYTLYQWTESNSRFWYTLSLWDHWHFQPAALLSHFFASTRRGAWTMSPQPPKPSKNSWPYIYFFVWPTVARIAPGGSVEDGERSRCQNLVLCGQVDVLSVQLAFVDFVHLWGS